MQGPQQVHDHRTEISTAFPVSYRHKINWKNGQQNFIMHFKETVHLYNEINDTDPFSDNQLLSFLNVAVSGVPNLAQVLTNNQTSRRAANNNTDLTWEEYSKIMIQHAQVYNAANTHTRNPKAQTQVNFHEHFFNRDMPHTIFDFDQNTSPDSNGYHVFKVNMNKVHGHSDAHGLWSF